MGANAQENSEDRADKKLDTAQGRILKEAGVQTVDDLDLSIEELAIEIADLKKTLEDATLSADKKEANTTALGTKIQERDRLIGLKKAYIAAEEGTAKAAVEKAKGFEEGNDLVQKRAEIKKIDEDLAKAATDAQKEPLYVRRAELVKEEKAIVDKKGSDVKRAERAAAMREFASEHEQEAKDAEADLKDALEGADKKEDGKKTDSEKPADPDAAPAAPAEGGQRSQDFNQKMSGIAFSLAKGLGDNPPDKQNIVGKVIYQGKALLLKITMAFAKHNEWVDELSKTQQTNLQETIGLKFDSNVKGANGETLISWVPPNPDYMAPDQRILSIFKKAYGDSNSEAAMSKIKPETTLADLKKDPNNKNLVDAMTNTGAAPTVKVLEYLEANSADLKDALDAAEAAKKTKTGPEKPAELKLSGPDAARTRFRLFGLSIKDGKLQKGKDEIVLSSKLDSLKVTLGASAVADDGKLYLECKVGDTTVKAEGKTADAVVASLQAALVPPEPAPGADKPAEPATPAPGADKPAEPATAK